MTNCVLCDLPCDIDAADTVLVRRGLETLFEASEIKGDNKVPRHKYDSINGITVHISCRKTYTRHVQSPIKKKKTGSEQDATRQTRSKIPTLRFKEQCLFCEQSAMLGPALSSDVSLFTGSSEQIQNMKDIAKKRQNEHDLRLMHHLSNVYDLTAVDARYHRSCLKSFYANCDQNVKSTSCGRPTEKDKFFYFKQLCVYLEGNEECQYSILDLHQIMKSFASDEIEVYNYRYLLQKLKEHYNDRIVISQTEGKETIICLKSAAQKVIRQLWTNESENDPRVQRIRKVEEAAVIVSEDIRSVIHKLDNYETVSTDNVNDVIPESLNIFLKHVIKREQTATNVDKKIITIAHAIISAVRPRSFLSSLHLSLAVWLHMKFASRVLIDMLSALGICATYAEVQRFELSATTCPATKISSNAFLQFAFDNADINKQTLTGHDTFHNMGGIMCVAPASAAPKLKTLRRVINVNITDALNDRGKIPTFHYTKSFKSGLRHIVAEGINFHDDLNVDCFLRMDILSLSRSVISSASPSWSGFMQIATVDDRNKDTTAITFLPFINMAPSNPSSIYTALKFAAKECARHGQGSTIVTFDQPLFYKAMDIVSAMQIQCELKNIIVRLGGFHFLMSFLGAVGYIMAGSGIEELFGTVYAANSVPHILTGKHFSRSIRAHLLAIEALIAVIFNESEHYLDTELDEAKQIIEQLMTNEISTLEAIQASCVLKLSEFIICKLRELSQNNRTSKLWSQYFYMVTLIRLFIRAERTGDWKLHLYCIRKMLPFLAAAGHLNYTKCAYLYYQSMQSVQSKMSEVDYEKFVKSGYFTIRRSAMSWSGVWSDMIIEQTLMRSIKSVGGISHGRGYSDSVLCKYINSLPVCAQFSECLEQFSGIESKSSEQHKDIYSSRNTNDIKHATVFADWFKLHSPFSMNNNDIISLSTGAVGDVKINCDLSEDIGKRILHDMTGKNFADIHIRRTDKALPLAAMYKAIKIDNDIIPINTNQIMHRMMCLNLDKTDQKASMCYELAAVSTALFDENGTMRRGQKSKLQELLTTYANDEILDSNNVDSFVIDGGFLLHKLCWPRPATWSDILTAYVDYVIKHYGTNSTIIFDGYEKSSTKNQLQQSRSLNKHRQDIDFKPHMTVSCKQSDFLSVAKNKSRLIEYLKNRFETSHIIVRIAETDADELIAKSALAECTNEKNVCVVCNDTDIIVILLSRATTSMKLVVLAPGHNGSVKLFNISQIQKKLGITAKCLPFIHAMTGCDTTSAPFMRGKKTAFDLVHKFTNYSTVALSFNETHAEKSEIIKSGEKFMLALYNSTETSLDSARFHAYQKKVSNSNISAEFKLATLPPTSDAAAQHSLRVYLQVQQWLGYELQPTNYGWKKNGSILVPVIMLQPAAPDQLLHLITCNCASDCSSGRCSCKKSGLFCTAMCGQCRGIDCLNNAGDEQSDQSDSDEPQTSPSLGRKRSAAPDSNSSQ